MRLSCNYANYDIYISYDWIILYNIKYVRCNLVLVLVKCWFVVGWTLDYLYLFASYSLHSWTLKNNLLASKSQPLDQTKVSPASLNW